MYDVTVLVGPETASFGVRSASVREIALRVRVLPSAMGVKAGE